MTQLEPITGEVLPQNPQHREVVRCLAIGYTWDETARVAKCSKSTVAKLNRDYVSLIERLRAEAQVELERTVYANFGLALDIERRMLTGELDPSDRRYEEARRIVTRFTDRLFFIDRRPAADGPAGLEGGPGLLPEGAQPPV